MIFLINKLSVFYVCVVFISYTIANDDDIPELNYLNTDIDPCDDFYEFSCGNFKNVHQRPPNTVLLDQFTLLSKDILSISQKILETENSKSDPVALKKARAAYHACVDTRYADTLPNPEVSVIQEVKGFPLLMKNTNLKVKPFSWNDVADLIGEYGIPMIFGTIQSLPSYYEANKTSIYLRKEQLLLPQLLRPEEYVSHEDIIEHSLSQYATQETIKELPLDVFLKNITLKLRDATYNYWTSKEEILENLAQTKQLMVKLYSTDKTNPDVTPLPLPKKVAVSLGELQEWTNAQFGDKTTVNWVEFFKRVFKYSGLKVTENLELMAFTGLNNLLYNIIDTVENADPNILKNFCLLRIFLYMAPDSDAPTRQAFDEYFIGINQPIYKREEYCTRKVIDLSGTASLSFAIAYEYQLHFFNVNKLEKAAELINDLWQSFTDILVDEIDWMDDETKEHAIFKVKNMITLLGYPEIAEDAEALDKFYENLRICTWDNFGNSKRIRALKQSYQLSQARSRDRTVWDKSPFDANAFYTRATNRIIFPVAMLNPIFFTGTVSILDYARIGSIIGHEITHGFDNQGQLYNEDGIITPQPWISPESQKAFNSKVQCFVDQYSQYYVPESQTYVNGTTTLNENLADNGGIRESYKAMKKYVYRHKPNSRFSNYTNDQLFFIGYGTMWCADASDYYYELLAKSGSYAPSKWRVNGPLSNLEEFSRAFDCPVGSNMNPADKCRLW